MEEFLGLISIGILVGLIVIYYLSEIDRKQQNKSLDSKRKRISRLQNQRDKILQQLNQKLPEKTKIKDETVALIYQLLLVRISIL